MTDPADECDSTYEDKYGKHFCVLGRYHTRATVYGQPWPSDMHYDDVFKFTTWTDQMRDEDGV